MFPETKRYINLEYKKVNNKKKSVKYKFISKTKTFFSMFSVENFVRINGIPIYFSAEEDVIPWNHAPTLNSDVDFTCRFSRPLVCNSKNMVSLSRVNAKLLQCSETGQS